MKISSEEEKSTIKQGTIAGFMRKRTQLVGFEMGYWKHVQYCSEFLDNALDAIESFQWKELQKKDSKITFTLDRELEIQKLSFLQGENAVQESKTADEEESGEIIDKDQLEVEVEVKRILDDMEELINPIDTIVDVEPIVVIRLRESEAPSFLTAELSKKNVMNYTFEIFDNGTGMGKVDLRKFGKYLASSKSMELKQTRGSQGFGSPSAFSDAQNTTGKPIVAVSKSAGSIYGTVSEFFTTSKNEKKYLVHPTEVDSPFLHGTYIKLNFLNVKFVRGYAEVYIKETAFLNPHITIVFIDPFGEQSIYPRLVSSFPKQPKYAKPHPSSTNIGDLQDLLAKAEDQTISAFLQENFVRISAKTSKQILDLASKDLQDKIGLFILKSGYLLKCSKKIDPIFYMSLEQRVFGKSQKPRDKLVIYELKSEDIINGYWELISKYDQFIKKSEKTNKIITKNSVRIEKAETKKEKNAIQKENKASVKEIEDISKEKEKVKNEFNVLISNKKDGIVESKKAKNRDEMEDLVKSIQLSKIKPADLNNDQFNSLFLAFKSIKYMAPPTDTAIPVGASILENSLTKELGLKLSENPDDFDNPVENIIQTTDLLQRIKKDFIAKDDSYVDEGLLDHILPYPEEIDDFNSSVLDQIDLYDDDPEITQYSQKLLNFTSDEPVEEYESVFTSFLEKFSRDDDFIAAETRDPTSGKGLAYVVEAVLAHSKTIGVPKRSRDVLSRFVNRTVKLRDSADCAITKAVQSVNWKNYKLEVFDNNLPKGPIKLLVNISGPFVHLMFKSQSKNALADDENLIKEIKYCLEAIGRKIRVYINRRASFNQSQNRSKMIEGYIPTFVKSLYVIASQGGKFKDKVKKVELETMMKEAIGKKPVITLPKEVQPEIQAPPIKDIQIKETVIVKKETIKPEIITPVQLPTPKAPIKVKPIKPKTPVKKTLAKPKAVAPGTIKAKKKLVKTSKGEAPSKPVTRVKPKIVAPPAPSKTVQTQLPIITTEKILKVLSNEWQTIKHLIFKMKIRDMMDARFLQVKLKELERKQQVLMDVKMGKKHWKLL